MTTGGSSSGDLWIDEATWAGEVVVETSEANATIPLSGLTADGETFDCGGMDIRLHVSHLPAQLHQTAYAGTHQIDLTRDREARLFVRVTQEDGHQAWSSPIYITRR